MSHAVRGAELEHFLEVGSCRVPVLPSAPLKRTVIVDLDFMEDEDDPERIVFGHESDGRFCLYEQGYGLEELKVRITLVRLTDYKTLHLVGGTSDDIEKDEEVTYAQGRAWQDGPGPDAFEPPDPPPPEEEEEEEEEEEQDKEERREGRKEGGAGTALARPPTVFSPPRLWIHTCSGDILKRRVPLLIIFWHTPVSDGTDRAQCCQLGSWQYIRSQVSKQGADTPPRDCIPRACVDIHDGQDALDMRRHTQIHLGIHDLPLCLPLRTPYWHVPPMVLLREIGDTIRDVVGGIPQSHRWRLHTHGSRVCCHKYIQARHTPV